MTQNTQILADLKRGKRITPIDALTKYGCFRLGARIYDLKRDGHKIEKVTKELHNGKRVAEYYMP